MIIDAGGGNVTILPTSKRAKVEAPPLEVVHSYKCRHGNFLVDEKKAEVECGICHEKLNPMWVLVEIATQDRILRDRWAGMKAEVELMKPKLRTKCKHCGEMTPIPSTSSVAALRQRADELSRGET